MKIVALVGKMKVRRGVHILKKAFCFFMFGLGGIVLSIIVFPLVTVFIHPKQKAESVLRRIVCLSFRSFSLMMIWTGVITLVVKELEILKRASPMLICANHPTLLDIVLLVGFIPNADCIVKAAYWKNPFVRRVVSLIYITNSLDPMETLDACRSTLDRGNHLVLFPETSRTSLQSGEIKFHRSAAQIALRTGRSILPVHIDVCHPSGLGKGERFFSAPIKGIIDYTFTIKDPIGLSSFDEIPFPLAARRLTEYMKTVIFSTTRMDK